MIDTHDAARRSDLDPAVADRLKRDEAGLVAAIVQQHDTGEVLMLGWMDDAALHATLSTGRATFWSRSRQEYWVKGATSGHRQWVKDVRLDCDGDAVLVRVDQEGAACHTGDRTCFDAGRLDAVPGERTGAQAPGPIRSGSATSSEPSETVGPVSPADSSARSAAAPPAGEPGAA